MRAKEFTINVPITISINGDEDPVVNAGNSSIPDEDEQHQNPVMVPPLQQQIELNKAEQGKVSPVIDKLTAPVETGDEDNAEVATPDMSIEDQMLSRIKELMSK